MDETFNEPDVWDGDRGATLLSFSATSLKDPVYEQGASRGTIHYSPIMHQTFLRKSPTKPNIFERLEFCYCTQRDLQTRRKNPKSTEARHKRALEAHPKTFHFRKDCLHEWKLDIPEVRKRRVIKKDYSKVVLSDAALLRESKATRSQIDDFENSLSIPFEEEGEDAATGNDDKEGGGGGQEKEEETKSSTIANKKKKNRYEGMSDEKIAEIKRIRKEQRRRMKERKKSQARLHFNHVGGIGTTALTPRSIRKVTELFSKITSI